MAEMGEILAELRKDKHLLQKDLADFLSISIGTVSNYETGAHEPDFETLCKLADFFQVSTDYLLGRTNLPYDIKKLNEPIRDGITISDITHTLMNMSRENLDSVLEYMELLTYKSKMIAERNNYGSSLKPNRRNQEKRK
ncbi:MAG: helix-turn-helix domain-containing protein [Roseburia sp.]|nr:helix-turn-helix domain-containing protein [Roseburia sp.]MCM1278664.1 helix-turn-helix domain-containing protein [Robinsoniella sp.]